MASGTSLNARQLNNPKHSFIESLFMFCKKSDGCRRSAMSNLAQMTIGVGLAWGR